MACALSQRPVVAETFFRAARDVNALRGPCPLSTASTRADEARRAAQFGDILCVTGRRHFEAVADHAVAPTRTAEARTAAQFSDIVSVTGRRHYEAGSHVAASNQERSRACSGRRHFEQNHASLSPCEVLPDTSDSYDASIFVNSHPRRFFDNTTKAEHYARLLGRTRHTTGAVAAYEEPAVLELKAGERLPLAFRRVLSAMMPSARDPDLTPELAEQQGAAVGSEVLRRLVLRTPCGSRATLSPGTSRCEAAPGCMGSSSPKTHFRDLWPTPRMKQQRTPRLAHRELEPVPSTDAEGRSRPDEGFLRPSQAERLPTLLTSRWERLAAPAPKHDKVA